MAVPGKISLLGARLCLGLVSLVSLFSLMFVLLVAGVKLVDQVEGVAELLDILPGFITNLSDLHWAWLVAASLLLLGLRLFCRRLGRGLKPAPEQYHLKFISLSRAVPEIAELLEKISAKRSYITVRELKKLTRLYRAAVDRQQRELDNTDRYPNGEKLWDHLDYV